MFDAADVTDDTNVVDLGQLKSPLVYRLIL
jgi:hypothetical protein